MRWFQRVSLSYLDAVWVAPWWRRFELLALKRSKQFRRGSRAFHRRFDIQLFRDGRYVYVVEPNQKSKRRRVNRSKFKDNIIL